MTDLTNGDLRKGIRGSLGVAHKCLDESFVAEPKKYAQNTELLSEEAKSGHTKLYEGYIEKFNEVSAQLDTANRKASDALGSDYRGLKCAEAYNMNAIYMHELYFANIGDPSSTLHVDSLPYMRLDRDFGGFDRWQADFIACGMAAQEGWVVTCLSTYLKRYVNVVVDGHMNGVPIGCFPLVVVDMWAHAYYKDYMTEKGKYLRNMMKQLDWKTIENRFERAERIVDALK